MSLDILTPKGREAADYQCAAVNAVLAQKPGTTFLQTALDGAAAIDGFFVRDNEIRAAAEVKSRMDMDEAKFFGERKGEWLITYQKISDLCRICDLLKIPGFGILYIVPSKLVLMLQLIDDHGFVVDRWIVKKIKTQRTINGDLAMRENALIPMHKAIRYKVK